MNSFSSDLNDGDGLLNWSSLQEWILQANLPGKGEIVDCVQLSGGTQNNLFLVTRDDSTEMVLRRPPRHPRPHNDRTMMREAKVLEALSGSDVPHPAFYAACDDPSIIGVCFYLTKVLALSRVKARASKGLVFVFVCCLKRAL